MTYLGCRLRKLFIRPYANIPKVSAEALFSISVGVVIVGVFLGPVRMACPGVATHAPRVNVDLLSTEGEGNNVRFMPVVFVGVGFPLLRGLVCTTYICTTFRFQELMQLQWKKTTKLQHSIFALRCGHECRHACSWIYIIRTFLSKEHCF